MYKLLDPSEYGTMTSEKRVAELRLWLTDQLDNHRAVLRSIAGTMPEADPDLKTVMCVDLKDLPTMMNDYEEDSAAYAVLKYRLENVIDNCDDSILDTELIGKIVMEILPYCDGEEDTRTLLAHRSFAEDMITICKIFCFDDLEKDFTFWQP